MVWRVEVGLCLAVSGGVRQGMDINTITNDLFYAPIGEASVRSGSVW